MDVDHCRYVTLRYTLSLEDGQVADRSPDGEPFGFIFGTSPLPPALEEKLRGMEPGQKTSVTLDEEEGYGPRDERLVKSIPLSTFPRGETIESGKTFVAQTPWASVPFQVQRVNGTEVLADFNHPLAGHTLRFDVWIEGVRELTAGEIQTAPAICGPGPRTNDPRGSKEIIQ